MDVRERRRDGGEGHCGFLRIRSLSLRLSCSLFQPQPPPNTHTPPSRMKNKKELTVEAGQQPRCQRFPLTRSEGGEKEG